MIAPPSVLPNIYIFWGNFMASLLPSTCRSPAPLKWHALPCCSGRLQRLPPPDGGPHFRVSRTQPSTAGCQGIRTAVPPSRVRGLQPGHARVGCAAVTTPLAAAGPRSHSLGAKQSSKRCHSVSRSRDLWRSPERDGQPCHRAWGPARPLAGICLPPLSSLSPRRPALAASLEQKTQVYGSHVTVSSTVGPPGASRPESIREAGDWHSSAQTPTLTTKSTGRWPHRTRPRVSVLGTEGMRRADFLFPPKTPLHQHPPSLQSPAPVS